MDRCRIPTVWCGNGKMPSTNPQGSKYTRPGTRKECLSKGFGAGMYSEKHKSISSESLGNLRYVGNIYIKNFGIFGVATLQDLETVAENVPSKTLQRMLEKVFTKSNGLIDTKAFNSTIYYLYERNLSDLPECYKL